MTYRYTVNDAEIAGAALARALCRPWISRNGGWQPEKRVPGALLLDNAPQYGGCIIHELTPGAAPDSMGESEPLSRRRMRPEAFVYACNVAIEALEMARRPTPTPQEEHVNG